MKLLYNVMCADCNYSTLICHSDPPWWHEQKYVCMAFRLMECLTVKHALYSHSHSSCWTCLHAYCFLAMHGFFSVPENELRDQKLCIFLQLELPCSLFTKMQLLHGLAENCAMCQSCISPILAVLQLWAAWLLYKIPAINIWTNIYVYYYHAVRVVAVIYIFWWLLTDSTDYII